MALFGIALVAQLAAATRQAQPVLGFPEAGFDDTAAYQGYRTRFFRDAAGNTVQIYLDGKSGRVVHLLADAVDESIGFTVRDSRGHPAPLHWGRDGAEVSRVGRVRTLAYRLVAGAPQVDVGWFVLGSMRVERDVQYAGRHRAPFAEGPYRVPELERLVAALGRLDPGERQQELGWLRAPNLRVLRDRLQPTVVVSDEGPYERARITQPSLDGTDTLTLDVLVNRSDARIGHAGDSLSVQSRTGRDIAFVIRVATTAPALHPLTRREIFTPEFLRFVANQTTSAPARMPSDAVRARWLEREVRGVELLASREKLMAGLPAYATYFGRDMLVSALMMRPIWRDEMSELVIASVLRKLSPAGEVSHEEALGGQADREAAAQYAALIDDYTRASGAGERALAGRLLDSARAVLRTHARTRENYHMIDNAFQLPVLAGRWLADSSVPAARKRAFLFDSSDGGGPRLSRLLRELAYVGRLTAAYASQPTAANLVSFAPRGNGRWASASWRDSDVGYAGGRYAMDVNAIWAPHALEAMDRIFTTFTALGISRDSLAASLDSVPEDSTLSAYLRNPDLLRRAIDAWSGAWRHFLIRLSPSEVHADVAARIDALPDSERVVWRHILAESKADRDSLVFLDLSLDTNGRPIGVANSDPATRLFLGDDEQPVGSRTPDSAAVNAVLRDVRLFVRPYPVGLFIDAVGPVVANDAYAPPPVWAGFERDQYHGPRVVWGREVNLFLLGVADRIAQARGDPALAAYTRELRDAAARVQSAAQASGFHSELWSYRIAGDRVLPVRYGTGSDVQLWSTTDLAVEYALAKLGTR